VRALYSLSLYALSPLWFGALLLRGVRERGYWHGLAERLGFGAAAATGALWVHAASAGEVQAAAALIGALRRQHPSAPLLLTTFTPAGKARAQALFAAVPVTVRYLPLDLPGAVRRFVARVRPRCGIVLETELWPNLYRACARHGVPIALASARMSARSARRYRHFAALMRGTLSQLALIGAQSRADAERFRTLGADPQRTHITGNLKFDWVMPPETLERGRALRARYASDRPVWVAGSTHAGEEEIVLAAHTRLCAARERALLVLAPRHPRRFAEVASRLTERGVAFARRSAEEPCGDDTRVLLVDTLGELLDFYAAGDIVFVGGSLVPVGGHNLLEPAALARPILSGPAFFNNPEVARRLLEREALELARDETELADALERLLANPALAARRGELARAVLEENRGALARVLELLAPYVARGENGDATVAAAPSVSAE
jgi:3-deoxy-D-manno-octulosonic-acid transferase